VGEKKVGCPPNKEIGDPQTREVRMWLVKRLEGEGLVAYERDWVGEDAAGEDPSWTGDIPI